MNALAWLLGAVRACCSKRAVSKRAGGAGTIQHDAACPCWSLSGTPRGLPYLYNSDREWPSGSARSRQQARHALAPRVLLHCPFHAYCCPRPVHCHGGALPFCLPCVSPCYMLVQGVPHGRCLALAGTPCTALGGLSQYPLELVGVVRHPGQDEVPCLTLDGISPGGNLSAPKSMSCRRMASALALPDAPCCR